MIKFINFILRIACALAFGIILMCYDRPEILVLQGAGLLFGISGLLALAEGVVASIRGRQTIVPFTAYGSALAAFLTLIHPDELVPFVPVILGVLLILDCGNQVFNLLSLKFRTSVRFAYFIAPAIVLLYGIFLLFQKEVNVLVGLSFLLFTISEIVVTATFFKYIYLNKTDMVLKTEPEAEATPVAAPATTESTPLERVPSAPSPLSGEMSSVNPSSDAASSDSTDAGAPI